VSRPAAYRDLDLFYGDLHNHCGISYGRGSLEEAYTNARLQLDFASVTGHAHWPDMPVGESRLEYLVEYHRRGFERLASMWDGVQETTQRFHEDGRFVSFLSFEWHSMRHGDYCVCYKGSRGEIIRAPDLEALRSELGALAQRGGHAILIPHHIGYRAGYRGIAWDTFDERLSPVVEIVSMHGCAEDGDAPRPYLHAMGPRDGRSSMLHGLLAGRRFGIIGSTDHHSAHPGSHGHGRCAVWASELSRDGIWEALQSRRTVALTGDRIEVAFAVNGAPIGAALDSSPDRTLEVAVTGGGPLDCIEIIKNGAVLARRSEPTAPERETQEFRGKLALAVGWGERPGPTDWEVVFGVTGGRLLGVEPRFAGEASMAPLHGSPERYQVSSWERIGDRAVRFRTRTWRNPTPSTDGTQKLALEIEGDAGTQVIASVNGREAAYPLSALRQGPRAGYLGGFVSEAYQLSRAVPRSEYDWSWTLDDRGEAGATDFYYVRVRQKNDQWAWTSPVWI
jgi:hypothetical protein